MCIGICKGATLTTYSRACLEDTNTLGCWVVSTGGKLPTLWRTVWPPTVSPTGYPRRFELRNVTNKMHAFQINVSFNFFVSSTCFEHLVFHAFMYAV